MKHKTSGMDRRKFLKTTGIITGSLCFDPSLLFSLGVNEELNSGKTVNVDKTSSLVVTVFHSKATDQNGNLNRKIIRLMLDEGIRAVTNSQNHRDGWRRLFPEYLSEEIIGIKVNAANYQLPTHPELTYSIADSLKESGFDENNILIWDCYEKNLTKSAYNINDRRFDYLCFGTSRWGIGYDENVKVAIPSEKIELPLSKILSQYCDYIINAPVLKNATPSPSSGFDASAGVSLSLKNAYGYIPLNDQFWQFKFFSALKNMKAMHAHNCNPQIAELNASPVIRKKTRLSICDAILGIYDGGPYGPPQWIENKIIISSDLVALDTCGLKIIEEKRKEMKMSSVLNQAGHIDSAAKIGLGNNDTDKIEHINLNLG